MAKSIVVSGASGFVGVNLTNHLIEQNWSIFRLGRDSDAEYQWTDLNRVKTANAAAIIHLAGKAHDLSKTSNDREYFEVNTNKTIELFDLFLDSEVRDFIYFSSVKAVADVVEDVLFEDVIANPKTPYGQSKMEAERYLLNKTLPKDKRLFVIRPCMIHGPGNKGNLNLLYKVVEKGIPYPLGAFHNHRSFLSIANLNYMIDRLISDPNIPGGVYNVADDEPLSTNQVIEIISRAIGRKPKLWRINQSFIKGIAKVGDILRLPLNSERLKKLTESYVVSNDKIKQALNIKNLPISSTEGLLTTIESFRSNTL